MTSRFDSACHRRRIRLGGALCLLFLVASNGVLATSELEWGLGAGVEHSSNPGRVSGDADSGVIRRIEGDVGYRRETRPMDALLELEIGRAWYPEGVFEDDVELSAYGELDVHLLPDHFTWVTRNRFAQVRETELAAETPDNRQNVNAFVTGPDVSVPLTSVDSLRTSLRYGRYDFSESETDNVRHAATVGAERRISARTSLSLNAGIEQVDFDVETDTQVDFDRISLFARMERTMPRGSLGLDLGYNEVRREGRENISGPLVNLRADRRFGTATTAGFLVSAATTDPVSGIASSPDDPLAARVDRVSVTGEVGEIVRARTFLNTRIGAAAWTASAGVAQETFDDPDREIDRYDGRLGVNWGLTSLLGAYATTSLQESHFDPADNRERIVFSTLGLERRFGRTISARLGVSRYDQRFTDPANDVRDDRVILTVRYADQRSFTSGWDR